MGSTANPAYSIEDSDKPTQPQYTIEDNPTSAPPAAPPPASMPPSKPGALSRFASSYGSALGVPSSLGNFEDTKKELQHPMQTAKTVATRTAQGLDPTTGLDTLASKGWNELKTPGHRIEGAADLMYSGIPYLGSTLSRAGHQFEEGDVAGGVGSTLGAATPIALGSEPSRNALKGTVNAVRGATGEAMGNMGESIAGPVVRKPPAATQQDLKFGRNPAAAITKEPGLSGLTPPRLSEALSQRMQELGQTIDQTLSNPQVSGKKINIAPEIDAALASAKKSPIAKLNPGLQGRLDSLADNLQTQWGDLNKSPLDAARMKRDVGNSAKWTGQAFDNEANQFLVDVYRRINDKVNEAAPEVKGFNERYSDALSAKNATDRNIAYNTNRPMSVGRALLGAGGGAAGTILGGSLGGPAGAAVGLGLDAARSTPGRMLIGRGLSKLGGAQYPFPEAPSPQIPEATPIRGMLPSAPIRLGGIPDDSGLRATNGPEIQQVDFGGRPFSIATNESTETRPPRTIDLSDIPLSKRGGVIRRQPFGPENRGLALPAAPVRLGLPTAPSPAIELPGTSGTGGWHGLLPPEVSIQRDPRTGKMIRVYLGTPRVEK